MNWLELSVSVDQEAAESVSELLARYGYNGGVVLEPPWNAGDEGPEFSYDAVRPVTLKTYIPLDAQAEETRQRLEQGLWHLGQMRPVGPLLVRPLEEEDWANAWKQHYPVQRIGERTVIVPSWLEYEAQPDDVVLHLDPGMAFGTGLHPTTQLCVRLLERYVQPSQRTLDLGTGSGILAIAAAKLGAAPVLALDNDPIAVQAAAENVERNGVAATVTAELGSLGAGQRMGHWLSGDFGAMNDERRTMPASEDEIQPSSLIAHRFELIVANLIAKVLVILANDMAAAMAPGAFLVSSGIIIDREDEVALALAAAGLTQIERHREGEWVALVHQK
jgi:ribosomal protein L11 methyltransferase